MPATMHIVTSVVFKSWYFSSSNTLSKIIYVVEDHRIGRTQRLVYVDSTITAVNFVVLDIKGLHV